MPRSPMASVLISRSMAFWRSCSLSSANFPTTEGWTGRQTYLHIVTEHDAVDDAEAMYRRAQAFAAVREAAEFQAELTDLRDQLRLLSEMEACSIRNIL